MLQLSISHDVAYLSFNRPPSNTITIDLMMKCQEQLQVCRKEKVRAVFIRSSLNNCFSHGVDPEAIFAADLAGRKAIFQQLITLCIDFLGVGCPVLADVNGPAFAGGAVLTALADIVGIEANHGKIAFSEVKVGLMLPGAIQNLIAAKVPPARQFEIMVLGRNVNASDAVDSGLANFSYRSDTDKTTAFEGYIAKIKRLDRRTLESTLADRKAPLISGLTQFREDLSGFSKFLTDDHLGKGLRDAIKHN